MIRSLLFIAVVGLAVGNLSAQPLRLVEVANVGEGYLGVGLQDVNAERAKALKLPEEAGVEITKLDESSPAAVAGLMVGDVVMQYSGQRVEGNEQFSRLVRETPVGREVKLLVYRNGVAQFVTAKIGARPAPAPLILNGRLIPGGPVGPSIPGVFPDMPLNRMSWRSANLGWEVESLDGQLAEYFGVKEGALVRSVGRGSAADRAGLKAGDVITRVGDAKISTAADLTAHIRAGRGQTAAITVMRDHKELTVSLPLDFSQPGERF